MENGGSSLLRRIFFQNTVPAVFTLDCRVVLPLLVAYVAIPTSTIVAYSEYLLVSK
jgi:hypothetical protein